MKYSNTISRLSLNLFIFLFSALFSIAAFESIKAQEPIINSGLRFGDSELNASEEAMLKKFLDNYETPTDDGYGYPPIWDWPIPQLGPHGIIVPRGANPRINDSLIEHYDYIGGFYTDDNGELRCGGAGMWPDTLGIIFALHRDNPDTPEKDGFAFQEQIYFKLFSFSTMKDYLVDITEFDPEYYATDKWGALGISKLTNMQALEEFDFYIEPSGNPICIGDELTLLAQEFIGTGGNYFYQWSSDPAGFDYNVPDPPAVNPTQTTTYILEVQDGPLVSEHSLTIQVRQEPIAFAGLDGQVCPNETYVLSGEAQNYSSVEWTTAGDGEIDDPFSLVTDYTLGPGDISSGQVTFELSAMPKSPCEPVSSDQVSIDILALPEAYAGEDQVVCTTDDVEVSAVVSDYSSIIWTKSGDGYFENPTALTTLYFADGNDFQNGVDLYICAQAQNPCTATVCDTVHVDYVPGPTAIGQTSTIGCENNPITVSGAAYNYSSTEWTTEGDGTFENPLLFSTKYYPGVQDAANEGTTVTLNAYPVGNCNAATHDVTVNVVSLPDISFGPNSGNICMGDEFLQLDATVEHSNSILWSTNGDGTFSSTTIPNPKYYPGDEDEQNGDFELELLAYPLPYCSLSIIENLTVTYQDNPDAYAGSDATICEDETYELSEASAESFSNLNWSGGTGTFSNPSTLNPEYIPSSDEFGTTITLCLNAAPISPCDVAASDCMELTVVRLPVADAGSNADICEDETWPLDGSVLYTNDFTWSTSGDGTFSNVTIENPVYTPGSADIANGTVTLTLTAQPNAPCTTVAQDAMQLDIQLAATATAGNDAEICDIENLELLTAEAANYETLTWSTTGDGNFSDPTAENPTYFPGTNDIELGSVELTISATAIAPCADDITDTKTLTIIRSVETDAGADADICEGETWPLDGSVLYTDDFTWSTSGDGTFSSVTVEDPVYTPGSADIASGTVTLTLTAQPNSPCTAVAQDAMQLNIQLAATATAGDDAEICDLENHELSSADAANYETLTWSTTGDGNFSDLTAENPTYFPGTNDIVLGSVELTISATAIAPCADDIIDTKTLTIIRSVETDAGADADICEGETWPLDGSVLYTNDFTWSTTGDGTFSNASIEDPVYTPGSADIAFGTVTLTLTAQPNAPCTAVAQDAMQLDIQLAATATVGDDAEICDIENHELSTADAANYETLTWSTTGDGNFSDLTAENPTYFPGTNDIELGSVELMISATAIAPCADDIIDTKTLTIIRSVETDAGADADICEGETWPLDGSVLYTNDFTWSTSGDGTFSSLTVEDPIYTPGAGDIASGSVTLTLTAQPNSPCTSVAQDAMQLDIQLAATATAGDDAEICDIENHELSTADAANYETLIWSTTGDGNFSDPTAENPTYFPGTNDIELGSVELTISATAIAPCAVNIIDTKTLTIIRSVETDAGADADICEGEIWPLDGSVLYTNDFTWSTSGDGTFSNALIEDPVYTPGSADIANGTVTLTLTAQPNSPCTLGASDFITLEISPLAELNIGDDIEVCGTASILLDDVFADNYSGLLWTSSGDGTFSDPQSVNPEYYPGTEDMNNNQATLTLTLNPIAPCEGDVAANKLLSVALPPSAQAGDDITLCDDQIELGGDADNFNSVIWSTDGDGTFNDPSLLDATYYPGEDDFSTGQVQLTLTATANMPCTASATDALNVEFGELELDSDFVVDKDVQLGNLLFLSFSVSSQVSGNYKWYFNGEILPNQVNPFLIINNMQPENAGYYQGTFTNNCGTVETNEGFIQVVEESSQEIIIPGGWSGLSSFVTPDDPALESVFSEIGGDLIIMSNAQGLYWPGENVNTLGELSVIQGYEIKLANDATLVVDGKIRYPFNELTVQPGWSFLPVNTNCAINVADQFDDKPGITMIKEIAGTRIYWPDLGINSLNELMFGKAYLIYNSSGNPVTFKYNACTKSTSGMNINPLIPKMQTPWNDLLATAQTHVIGFSAQALDELKSGDVIGVFNASGVCSGLEVVNQNENTSMSAFGDDMLTEITEGLVDGEEMNFRVYRPSTGETFEAEATFDNKSTQQNVFAGNGVSVIRKLTLKSATGINNPEFANGNIRIYPNPTSGLLNISIENTSDNKIAIDLINASGQLLLSKEYIDEKDFSIQIGDQPKGVYYLKVVSDGSVMIEKVILK